MTTPFTNDQQLVLDMLNRALTDAAASERTMDTIVDLAAFTAQARRLAHHLGTSRWPALTDAAESAAVWLVEHATEVKAAFDHLVPTEALDALETALCDCDDPDEAPDEDVARIPPILDALFDVDRTVSALETVGRKTESLVDEALDIVGCFDKGAYLCATHARRFVSRHGLIGGGAPVFAAVALAVERQSESSLTDTASGDLTVLPDWLVGAIDRECKGGVRAR